MTQVEIRCRCGGQIETIPLDDVPPPPGAILATVDAPPSEWKGWRWVCTLCGTQCGVTYDYGELDLGIVRDSVLHEREPMMDVWIYEEEK